jgi:hypothetical protein
LDEQTSLSRSLDTPASAYIPVYAIGKALLLFKCFSFLLSTSIPCGLTSLTTLFSSLPIFFYLATVGFNLRIQASRIALKWIPSAL